VTANKIIVGCLLTIPAFWLVAPFVPRLYLFDLLNALSVCAGLSFLSVYLPGAVYTARMAYKRMSLNQGNILVLGIVCFGIGTILRTMYLQYWRSMDEPVGQLDGLIMAFAAWMILIGSLLHRISPKVEHSILPMPNRRGFANTIAFGIVLAIILFLVRWKFNLT